MNEQTQTAIDILISVLDHYEPIARADLEKEFREYCGTDRFSAGRVCGISLYWECPPESDEDEQNAGWRSRLFSFFKRAEKASTEITLDLETSGYALDYGDGTEYSEKDFSFITAEIFENDIAPAWGAWLREKVCNEKWGGLFDAQVVIGTSQLVSEYVILVEDEKRMQHRIQLVRDFIIKKEYETENLEYIEFSFNNILRIAATDLYDELGVETLTTFYRRLLERAIEWKKDPDSSRQWWMVMFASAMTGAADALTDPESKWPVTEEKFHLACRLCLDVMRDGDEYVKEDARSAFKMIAKRGSAEAKNILKFGAGLIAPEIMQYQDDLVTCSASDVTKVIAFNLKEETEAAYRAMLEYILRLIGAGFPRGYRIKFNSEKINYLPTQPRTKTQLFWNNCARYPDLWPKMKEDVLTVIGAGGGENDCYSDVSEDGETVPVGQYATFALSVANANICDIVKASMAQKDAEYSLSPDPCVCAYLDRYGINPQNAEAVVAAIINMNEPPARLACEYEKRIAGLEQPKTMSAIAEAVAKLDDDAAQFVADFLFGKANRPEMLIKNSGGKVKHSLEQVLARAKR
jgi:hypothetical protein